MALARKRTPLNVIRQSVILGAYEHWRRKVEEEKSGGDGERVELACRTLRSLELEWETGRAHCICHLRPHVECEG